MMVKATPTSTFVMAQAEFTFEFFVTIRQLFVSKD